MKNRLEAADVKFVAYRQEIEQSPLSILRNELAQKQIELVEMESRIERISKERDDYQSKYENVKKDIVSMKRQLDKEKEQTLLK